LHCREAIEYAVNKKAVQDAYGGAIGGDIAGDFNPPWIAGAQNKTFYPNGAGNTGDLTAAKQQLTACGKPSGFSTTIAYRSDRPKEKNAAIAIQAALARVGIKLTLYGYPSADISTVIGTPSVVHKNSLGLSMYGWEADFPTGYGFMFATVDPAAIVSTGNSNIEEETNPAIETLFKQVVSLPTAAQREALYAQIDSKVMEDAGVVPLLYLKSLMYRPAAVTNVHVTYGYGMYDYTQLGLG
jgi:peptide/nickel transport system substrate-binding protein